MKKIFILIILFIIIIIVGCSDKSDYSNNLNPDKNNYTNNPKYCEKDDDCLLQRTSCNGCSCPIIINKYSIKPLDCPSRGPDNPPLLCPLACMEEDPNFKILCRDNICTGGFQ